MRDKERVNGREASWRIANHLKDLVLQNINFNNGELNMQNKQISKSENTSKDLIVNTTESIQRAQLRSSLKPLILGTGVLSTTFALYPELVLAAFDIDKGVTAGTKPLLEGIQTHWGKGVLLSGIAAALVGEGDPRQRAIRAGLGCGAAGVVVLGLIGMLG